MSEHCQRCKQLTELILNIWTLQFPTVTWVDAETALQYMALRYSHLDEQAARLIVNARTMVTE